MMYCSLAREWLLKQSLTLFFYAICAVALSASLAIVSAKTVMAAAPVFDGTVSPAKMREVMEQNKELSERLSRIERANSAVVDMVNRIEVLQRDVAQVSGQIEVQTHNVETMKKRQRELYIDLDRRISNLEQTLSSLQKSGVSTPGAGTAQRGGTAPAVGGAAAASGSNQTGTTPAGVGSSASSKLELDAYDRAFNLLKNGRYELATASFQAFLESFPDAKYADNAQYWLGEANYIQRRYKKAVTEFDKVVKQYPNSAKVPDALLKIGFAQIELGDKKSAIETLENIVSSHPKSTAARLAKKRLIRIKGG